MRISLHRKGRFERGSVLVTCMVLAGLGTVGVAAWIALLDARGHQVEQNLTALKRRAVENNSRALARLAMYENHLHDDEGLAADTTYEIPGGLGRATIRRYGGTPLSNQSALRYSKNGAVPLRAYTTDVAVDISGGTASQTWQYQLKNYNPILAGDLLVMNPPVDPNDPAPLVSGNLNVKGRAVFWDAVIRDYTAGLRADEIVVPAGAGGTTTFLDTNGTATAPLNYPIPRQTTGFAGAADPTHGGLDIVDSVSNYHNAYASRIRSLGTLLEIEGTSPYATDEGADTIPPSTDGSDSSQKEHIDQVAADGNGKQGLYNRLINSPELSSDVMMHALDNPSAFDAGNLFNLLDARYPLPNDVLTAVAGAAETGLTLDEKDSLLRSNGVWIWSDGAGKVTVYLDDPDLSHCKMTDTSELRLLGPNDASTADTLSSASPVAILVDNPTGTGLNSVTFDEQNKRRIVLAIATAESSPNYTPVMTFTGSLAFPDWRMILDLQNTGAEIDASPVAGVNMTGGIRANRPVVVSGGTLTLEREHEHEGLEALLSSNAWIESYKQ